MNFGKNKLPCLRYLASSEDWVHQLRGIRYFENMATRYEQLGTTARVNVTTEVEVPPCPAEVMFVSMPTGQGESLENLLAYADEATLIVDVTADVYGASPESMHEFLRGVAKEAGIPQSTWDFWHSPGVQSTHRQVLLAADLVTTSWEHLVEPLKEISAGPVVFLPDWQPDDSGAAFTTAWEDDVFDLLPTATGDRKHFHR